MSDAIRDEVYSMCMSFRHDYGLLSLWERTAVLDGMSNVYVHHVAVKDAEIAQLEDSVARYVNISTDQGMEIYRLRKVVDAFRQVVNIGGNYLAQVFVDITDQDSRTLLDFAEDALAELDGGKA